LHASPQADFFERFGSPDELGLLGHGAQLGRLDQNRRSRGLLCVGLKAAQKHELHGKSEEKAARLHGTPRATKFTGPSGGKYSTQIHFATFIKILSVAALIFRLAW
jgi:hypothetical protein